MLHEISSVIQHDMLRCVLYQNREKLKLERCIMRDLIFKDYIY